MQQTTSTLNSGDIENLKVFTKGSGLLSKFVHPVTGEDIVLDREDLMRNTQKCPFQNSVRDSTNFYFSNSDTLEKYYNMENAKQKTFNRRLKVKNSYITIFPMYGLHKNEDMFRSTSF